MGSNDLSFQTPALASYLLSKYELTQGQWLRLAGSNWSHWRASPLHPVENQSFLGAARLLARYDLEVPSEIRWEHAARAGTTSRW